MLRLAQMGASAFDRRDRASQLEGDVGLLPHRSRRILQDREMLRVDRVQARRELMQCAGKLLQQARQRTDRVMDVRRIRILTLALRGDWPVCVAD
ncbi:hypothetical protein ACH4E7_43305 [Kitasatospora sp. NPDC018058]|uniref:hypothetical protein n=1 Tax=Kitasatospora sp. NPDC018058 TaxID=3364025 RepID=UPI0037C0C190